ncbi:saccharopine dehydrogenase NADP-binding domain-containing protein [Nocardia vulneris]|uniref:saccharopine dehydrogenase family protein n=1 Tax=Nocardia vulneris TaxID=1141657 RepID=UPI0030CBBC35
MTSDTAAREFDLVVFGATGFTGGFIARYLADHAPAQVSIALAGRDLIKLAKVRDALPPRASRWTLVQADVESPASLDAMAARTRVVVTSVGPWLRYGENLVAAAVNAGCHYLDLTAEPPFVRWSIDKFHDQAVANGCRIVHSAGFDSIPSDLPVYLLHRTVAAAGEGTLTDTTMVVRKFVMWASGGSVDTGRVLAEHAFRKGVLRLLLDRDSLTANPGETPPSTAQPSDLRIVRAATVDPALRGTLVPFAAAFYNTRVVRRSNALLGDAYGPGFRYSETLGVTQLPIISTVAAGAVLAGYAVAATALVVPPIRRILDRLLPTAGHGPSETIRDKGVLDIETYTRTTTGARYVAHYHADGDPGYEVSALMIGQAALALVQDGDRLPEISGVLTTAAAFGDVLIDRLRAAGLTLDCRRLA